MPNQLSFNRGTEDALLYSNANSIFTREGYARTSNFQVELVDVQHSGATSMAFGKTVTWKIPRVADLLGPVDLIVDLPECTQVGDPYITSAWVESLGHAMIERAELRLSGRVIETLTGEQLNIQIRQGRQTQSLEKKYKQQ